ncbi:MAG: anti-sigma regulatory factor [Planctomycetota bacterium]|jgi:serine/threonine-protein kinase RsbT
METREPAESEIRHHVRVESDVTVAVLAIGRLAGSVGFDTSRKTMLMTVASELGTNICKYAGSGWLIATVVSRGAVRGIEIVAEDNGPGIADISSALRDHFSSSGTLGLGLPGVRRMVDSFDIRSAVGQGTTVRVVKWSR